MDYIELIEEIRAELLQVVNQRCDDMIRMYQNGEPYNRSEIRVGNAVWEGLLRPC